MPTENKPADPKRTGLSQGWNLTRKHDGFVVGHQSVAYPPEEKAIERAERDGYVWVPFLVPAAQPEGEPVAHMPVERCYDVRAKMIIAFNEAKKAGGDLDDALDAAYKSALRYSPNPMNAEQSAPVEVVPDGYCIMPRQLTAENGAKALLLGEFKLLATKECPECCELEEPTEGCSMCDGEGEYGQKHTIPWDQIKFIYSKAVEGLAVKAEPAKSR
jgi:hypothetical protein